MKNASRLLKLGNLIGILTGMADDLLGSLKSRGWYLKDITVVEDLVQQIAPEDFGRPEVEKLIETKLLDMDLRTIGGKCLPDASSIQRTSRLQGPKVLQACKPTLR
eukprot:Gb_06577 [translate_table: standard]